jgi:hypothetical protein
MHADHNGHEAAAAAICLMNVPIHYLSPFEDHTDIHSAKQERTNSHSAVCLSSPFYYSTFFPSFLVPGSPRSTSNLSA